MTLRPWVTQLVLGLCCAGASCTFDSSPLGSPVASEVGFAGTGSPTVEGTNGTAGAASTADAASSGAGTGSPPGMNPTSAAPTGAAGTGAAGALAPELADAGSAGSGGTTASTAGSAAGSGEPAADSGTAGPTEPPMSTTGTLPAIADPALPGPFAVQRTNNVGPLGSYTIFEPTELGKYGILHPILVWGPGAGSNPDIYLQLLQHIASHGFVVLSYNTSPQGPELTRGIDWIIEEATTAASPYFDKVDTTKIAIGGQSAGSVATFASGNDPRITTTLHMNGGTFVPDDARSLIKPAFFLCGDDPAKSGGDGTWQSDIARPYCDAGFMNAPVPAWYGVVIGSSHTTVIDTPLVMTMSPLKVHYLASTVAWLRWQLAGDLSQRSRFVGPDCGFCKQTTVWEVQQKDLM